MADGDVRIGPIGSIRVECLPSCSLIRTDFDVDLKYYAVTAFRAPLRFRCPVRTQRC
jgi:hypothetical protein